MHKSFAIRVVVTAFVLLASLLTFSIVRADSSSPWISSQLFLNKQANTQSLPSSWNGNIDCNYEDSVNCSVATNYGSVTQNSTARLNSTSDFTPVLSYIENRQRFLPIPNSSTAITYTTEPTYGFYLHFNYNFPSTILKSNLPGMTQVAYKLNHPPDGKLVDKTNRRLPADYTSMSFSKNGQWMVVSSPNLATLRVNLQTFEVVPFGPGFNYTIGLDPSVKTAITNDGRYAVVASKNFSTFKLYDLNTCGSVPDMILGPASCQSRDLGSFMQQSVPGFNFISHARFMDSGTLAVYATYGVGSVNKTARFIIGTSAILNQINYLALGDSYISGEGAFSYQGGTDTEDNRCHLSLLAYPYLIGLDLNYDSYHSVACSGAKMNDVTNLFVQDSREGSQVKDKKEKEFDDEIYSNFLPGYRAQVNFVSKYQPKIINVTIGGNDIGFSSIVTKCAAIWNIDNCYESYEDRLELVREINSKFPDLVNTYSTVKNQGAPDARIYIIGYPQIAKVGGSCALNVRLSDKEARFSQQIISYLNSVIRAAAERVGVYYVDVEDALNGHRLCEAGPGSVAVNGLTAGGDFPSILDGLIKGPLGNESYHPNETGHQLLENKVLSATDNLTKPMPVPDPGSSPPPENSLEILDAPIQGRPVYSIQYNEDMSGDIILRGKSFDLSIEGIEHSLQPSGNYIVELHSEKTNLGTYSTDVLGNLFTQIQLPVDVPTGFHTLHVFGSNIAGESIDIYKLIYVGHSNDDWDGDGISNETDSCVVVQPAGEDFDGDKVDDGCDSSIDQAPPQSEPQQYEPAPNNGEEDAAGEMVVNQGTTSNSAPEVVLPANNTNFEVSAPTTQANELKVYETPLNTAGVRVADGEPTINNVLPATKKVVTGAEPSAQLNNPLYEQSNLIRTLSILGIVTAVLVALGVGLLGKSLVFADE